MIEASYQPRLHSPFLGDALLFNDRTGTRWQVFELLCADGAPCLIFESIPALRRIWNYPLGWRDLTSVDLATLSWAR